MRQSRVLAAAAFLLALPAPAMACITPTTFDYADPGASRHELRNDVWKTIGRVISVNDSKTAVEINVLQDYGLGARRTGETIKVSMDSTCGGLREDHVGAFMVQNGTKGMELVSVPWAF